MTTRKGLVMATALITVLLLSSCSAGNASSEATPSVGSGPISGTWIDVEVDGKTVVLPVSDVTESRNIHFTVSVPDRRLDFMAYLLGDELHIRANACPPCRSRGFALDGDILVCDMCKTTFKAIDGSGIEGACVDYPKSTVDYTIDGGAILMKMDELVRAYDDTLVAG